MNPIKRQSDTRQVKAWDSKLSFVPDGLAIVTSEIAPGKVYEGEPVGIGTDGKGHIYKYAEVASAVLVTDTIVTVKKGHHFKVGDVITAGAGGKAIAISAIATNATTATNDDLTITAGLVFTVGAIVYQATSATTGSDSTIKYPEIGLLSEDYEFASGDNLFVSVVTIGQICASKMQKKLPTTIKNLFKTIKFR